MAYIVNTNGATHSIPDSWLNGLIDQGARVATDTEIAAWYEAQGLENPYALPEPDPEPAAPVKTRTRKAE